MNNFKNSLEVIVVGNGFSALSSAWELKKAGAQVTVVAGELEDKANRELTGLELQEVTFEADLGFNNFLLELSVFPSWQVIVKKIRFLMLPGISKTFHFGPLMAFYTGLSLYEKYLFSALSSAIPSFSKIRLQRTNNSSEAPLA